MDCDQELKTDVIAFSSSLLVVAFDHGNRNLTKHKENWKSQWDMFINTHIPGLTNVKIT